MKHAQRWIALLGVLVGGIGTILAALNAFGVDLSEDQQKSIAGLGSLLLLLVSAWLSPDIPTP